MFNIFLAVFFGTLACAFIEPFFFIGYLISLAIIGLYQAVFMANAGGAWDNAKKIVETELHAKGTELHNAAVVGDTVGDPFKDTSSVAMNPIIKFTTLFGLLAVEMAVGLAAQGHSDSRPDIWRRCSWSSTWCSYSAVFTACESLLRYPTTTTSRKAKPPQSRLKRYSSTIQSGSDKKSLRSREGFFFGYFIDKERLRSFG
jgi:hypothetical protein